MSSPFNPNQTPPSRPQPLTEERGLPTPRVTPPMPKVTPPKQGK